ncbi:hypothetical protein [Anaeromyxobacter oryzae]|uniref:Uncharacterized protein n=1 Tax=Anaeromyxobacter oryzae TaxID=2918170 RepID=A0ABN6N0P3_9BACT|nr:hypothetical protein [Anaeromyxobacter oryzae]BDG06130.1 hypothetical protein AMOR_51260 [Anaeromyxobacter oryzae]
MIAATTSAPAPAAAAPPDPGATTSARASAGAPPRSASAGVLLSQGEAGDLGTTTASGKGAAATSTRRTIARRTASVGYAPSASTAASVKASTAKAPTAKAPTAKAPLGFLSDTKLSVDERLFRLMMYVSDKYEKELDKKLKEIQTKAASTPASGSASKSSGSKKKSSLLGNLGGVLKAVAAPGLALLDIKEVQSVAKVVAGPALAAGATALGFPQAAPALMQLGPQIVGAASQLSTTLDALGGSSSGGGASSGGSSSSSSSSGTPEIDQVQIMELQRVMEKQKEMFGLVSNILGSMHQTRMSIINNVRA